MTAEAAAREYADAVMHAVRTLRRHLDDPDPARSMAACVEMMNLECTRIRHGRHVAGTEGASASNLAAADEPLVARPGRPRDQHRAGDDDHRGASDGEDDFGFDPEAFAELLDLDLYAEMGVLPDGCPDLGGGPAEPPPDPRAVGWAPPTVEPNGGRCPPSSRPLHQRETH